MEESKLLSTIEEVKAISDPFKYRILMQYKKLEKPATVKQIADGLNEVPAKVHYHVKKMESLGILRLVYTEEIRGIVAKFYEPTAKNYEIKYSKELSDVNKKVMLAESGRLIGELYDTSKNTFLEQMDKQLLKNEKSKGTVMLNEILLTHNEENEFLLYIKEFVEKHSIKAEKDSEKHKYHFMISIAELIDEE